MPSGDPAPRQDGNAHIATGRAVMIPPDRTEGAGFVQAENELPVSTFLLLALAVPATQDGKMKSFLTTEDTEGHRGRGA